MSDVVIRVENLGKKYTIQHQREQQRYVALRDVIANRAKSIFQKSQLSTINSQLTEDFWALKDVSFEIKQGEVVGIIGRNGAGKSTLLKILSRITEPSRGRVGIRGHVASLLEVGTGFHPELTGRENIYLNGAVLGMSRFDVKRRFDEIVTFAEVEKFLDTPVKRYSSGMYMRLAFAVAAHLEPEILIVDEVLAVGDTEFQKKCLGKMKDVATGGRTVLFVSHNMTAVRSLCIRGVLLNQGSVIYQGGAEESISQYLMGVCRFPNEKRWFHLYSAPGNDLVRITAIRAISRRSDNEDSDLFDMTTPIDFEVEFTVLKKSKFHITLHFVSDQGITAFSSYSTVARDWKEQPEPGEYKTVCMIPPNLLNEGGYTVRLLLVEEGTRVNVTLEDVIGFEVKDLSPRRIGEWQGREPGPVKPQLNWEITRL